MSVGTAVTLTATATPAVSGTVYFCEATAKLCSKGNNLGEAQFHNGTATFKFFPSIGGPNSYVAQYAGTIGDPSSLSNAAALTVTGKQAVPFDVQYLNADPARMNIMLQCIGIDHVYDIGSVRSNIIVIYATKRTK